MKKLTMNEYLELFNKGYKNDSQYWGSSSSNFINIIPQHIHTENDIALDLGCGQGRNINALLNKGYKVIGVDKLNSAIKSSQEIFLNNSKVELVCQDILEYLGTNQEKEVQLVLANQIFQCMGSKDVTYEYIVFPYEGFMNKSKP